MIDARREVAARTRDYELSGIAFVGKDRDLVSCDRDERAAGRGGRAGGGEGGLAPMGEWSFRRWIELVRSGGHMAPTVVDDQECVFGDPDFAPGERK
eukprot:2155552-Rhodomonas_salina.1